MKKKFGVIVFLFLLFGCGFAPVLKNIDNTEIKVKELRISGNVTDDTSFLLKNYLSFNEKNVDGLDILIVLTETFSSIEKDSAGISIKDNFIINVQMIIKKDDKILTKDNFSESKEITITSNPEIDEQNKNNERKNILRNISRKIKFKTLIISKNYK